MNAAMTEQLFSSKCPACESSSFRERIAIADREYCVNYLAHYAECAVCGTLSQAPMPSLEQLASFYPATYHAANAQGALAEARHRSRLKRLTPMLMGEGALLDYGCGNGAFLRWAAGKGLNRQLIGYEIGPERKIERLADGEVTIVHGRPEHLLDILPPCRLISMNHVIEHLPDPFSTITALVTFLTLGGALDGETPAADSLERRCFGRAWSGYHAPRHTVIFSRRGLYEILKRARLVRCQVSGAFNPAALAVSLGASTRSPTRGISRRGVSWLALLVCATILTPIDLLSGAPGIVKFRAFRSE